MGWEDPWEEGNPLLPHGQRSLVGPSPRTAKSGTQLKWFNMNAYKEQGTDKNKWKKKK